MTPKQKYDQRNRLRAERLLREEQRKSDHRNKEDDMEARMNALLQNFERVADGATERLLHRGENRARGFAHRGRHRDKCLREFKCFFTIFTRYERVGIIPNSINKTR